MPETLYLAYEDRLSPEVAQAIHGFDALGLRHERLLGEPKDGSLVLLVLDLDSTEESIYGCAPWLQEQFAYSSLRKLRLMPFLFFRGEEGDIEERFDALLSETFEAVVSGEFKPFGYDLDSGDPLREFPRILRSYEE